MPRRQRLSLARWFNPALRAYLATEADARRIEAFATLNMFNRAGSFLGPLIGLAFVTSNFRMSVLAATVIFAVLALAQLLALPGHRFADPGPVAPAKMSIISDWRAVAGNRSFLRSAATYPSTLHVIEWHRVSLT
ncbi:hypothetical protein A4G26_26170 [Mycobacterium kansasii]|nr:hypothetical protein A4G26_26170 [Mycobacterium kansasii]